MHQILTSMYGFATNAMKKKIKKRPIGRIAHLNSSNSKILIMKLF